MPFLSVKFSKSDDDGDVLISVQSSETNSALTSTNLGHAVPVVLYHGNLCNAW